MENWTQHGFAVVPDVAVGEFVPYFHSFHRPEHEAQAALADATSRLPEDLVAGIRVVPAKLVIEL